jgi:hypothetical protein
MNEKAIAHVGMQNKETYKTMFFFPHILQKRAHFVLDSSVL